ncbi:MAG: phosphoenolpyruvate--protein phosphotransferase [Verrucomicrobiales bacterium]|jgi:phosphocarrier protein FPr|nr:phosphoenolpyruvate--protein phosphotransferase [Verrucomicrobiales bacterium]
MVLVSHCRPLAEATLTLTRAMAGEEVRIAVAAGAGAGHVELGTDAMEIAQAIQSVADGDGVVVLMDMGSAVLSAEMALDFLDEPTRGQVRLCAAAFVEGTVAAGVAAKVGGSLAEVAREASLALTQKMGHLTAAPDADADSAPVLRNARTTRVTVPNPAGLHARPVARLIQEAGKFQSEIQARNLTNGKGPVSIRSMTGMVALEALRGHEVELLAAGADEEQALTVLRAAIAGGLGDVLQAPPQGDADGDRAAPGPGAADAKPIGVCKGVAIGPVYYPQAAVFEVPTSPSADAGRESGLLRAALEKTRSVLREQAREVGRVMGGERGEIFNAQAMVLNDPALLAQAERYIRRDRRQAAHAWWLAVEEAIKTYQNLSDDNLRQRAEDLRDVARLVLGQLGVNVPDGLVMPRPGILVVNELTPGQAAALDKGRVLGVVCLEGGRTSHSSILLRSRGIPAIVQARHFAASLSALTPPAVLAMDGDTGELWLNPEIKELKKIHERQIRWAEQVTLEKRDSARPAVTLDGRSFEICANVGNVEDAETAAGNGADGIGLLRTEFMFLHRDEAPDEEEQVAALRMILRPMAGKPAVIRTLDAGGDKELPYLHMPREANPYLGVRAIRLCLRNRALFQQQLRAILRAGADYDVRVMFPMIATLQELQEAKAELARAHESLAAAGTAHLWPVPTGMMMEVPAAAIIAHYFVPEVDFVSIGTNDLTQYTLAADRGNPELQGLLSKELNPAVLAQINRVVLSCQGKIPVSVCGEAAAHPESAAVFLGLGVRELSMSGRSIPAMKHWVRGQSLSAMEQSARELLTVRLSHMAGR